MQAVSPVLDHVQELIERDDERLTDHGNDRSHSNYNCLLNTNLPRIITRMGHNAAPLLQRVRVRACCVWAGGCARHLKLCIGGRPVCRARSTHVQPHLLHSPLPAAAAAAAPRLLSSGVPLLPRCSSRPASPSC